MAGVSVEKRGDSWRYRFDTAKINGKRNRIQKGGFATKREAQAAGAEAFAEYNRCGLVFKPNEISYADYLDYWVDEYCRKNLKTSTTNMYMQVIDKYIAPKLGMYSLPNITATAMQRVINELFDAGFSRATLRQVRSIMCSSLGYAVEPSKFIRENPAIFVSLPKVNAQPSTPTRSNPHIYISKDQMDAVFKRYPRGSNAHIPLMLGYHCGMRKSEAYAISTDDIDFENKTITINYQLQRDYVQKVWYISKPKFNSIRTIDIDDELIDLLRWKVDRIEEMKRKLGKSYLRFYIDHKWHVTDDPSGVEYKFLTVADNGKFIVPECVTQFCSTIRNKLRIDNFDFHSLRSTHSTMLLESGAPFKYVQERLGHKSVDVTLEIYQKVSPSILRDGTKTLNSLFKSDA